MRTRFTLAVVAFLVIVAVGITLVFGMRIAMSGYMYTSLSSVPQTKAALILGASVRRGLPSPVLANRANAAIVLYKAGKVEKILVTGDNGQFDYDEVTPVRKYLVDAGVAEADIFLDHAGFDTYSSMYRARDVFGVESMTIVTQDFHMPRSLFLARHLGINAYGYLAPHEGGLVRTYLREIPASLKAYLDLFTRRVPRFLGDRIPLSGTGTTTWY
jgi:SanA protein